MPFDSIFISALIEELKPELIGAKIDKIQQPEKDQLIFSLRGSGRNLKLLISAGSGSARIHLTKSSFENPQTPPTFCMLLRKHLQGAKIFEISQIPGERIVDFKLESYSELGALAEKHLLFELFGSRSNIILCDNESRIIDCIHRSDSEIRPNLPGLFYRLPEPMEKADPLYTDEETFSKMLSEAKPGQLLEKWLLDNFIGLPPIICREIVFIAYGTCEVRTGENEPSKIISAFMGYIDAVRNKRFTPILLMEGEKALDFSYMPIRQYGERADIKRFDSFSELLETFYNERDRAEHMRRRAQTITKTIRNLRDRTARKLENQRIEIEATKDRESLREKGDIITANLHNMSRGARVLKTYNFYSESGEEVEIALDPLLTPQENAAKYYKNYKKAKNAEIFLKEQIEKAKIELDYFESVLEETERATTPSELAEIRRELSEAGYMQKLSGGKKQKQQESAPLHYVSKSGINIFVGKNNIQNDRLTFKSAQRNDIWLHTQKIHGSHVIISCGGAEPDNDTLHMAASLAAYYSKAKSSKNVPVDYTRVRYVKKPAGGKPGASIYTDYKTIIVDPSADIG